MIAEENLKDYREEEKNKVQRQKELEILRKAGESSKKIEESNKKVRQSAMGGVITNNLLGLVDKFKKKEMKCQ